MNNFTVKKNNNIFLDFKNIIFENFHVDIVKRKQNINQVFFYIYIVNIERGNEERKEKEKKEKNIRFLLRQYKLYIQFTIKGLNFEKNQPFERMEYLVPFFFLLFRFYDLSQIRFLYG